MGNKKTTAIEIVKRRLVMYGYVTNFEMIDGRITTRLGAIICDLRKQSWNIDGDYISGTKNFKYNLVSAPQTEIDRIKKAANNLGEQNEN